MQAVFAILRERSLAFRKNLRLPRDVAQPAYDLFIPFYKAKQRIGNAHLIAEFLHKLLRTS